MLSCETNTLRFPARQADAARRGLGPEILLGERLAKQARNLEIDRSGLMWLVQQTTITSGVAI